MDTPDSNTENATMEKDLEFYDSEMPVESSLSSEESQMINGNTIYNSIDTLAMDTDIGTVDSVDSQEAMVLPDQQQLELTQDPQQACSPQFHLLDVDENLKNQIDTEQAVMNLSEQPCSSSEISQSSLFLLQNEPDAVTPSSFDGGNEQLTDMILGQSMDISSSQNTNSLQSMDVSHPTTSIYSLTNPQVDLSAKRSEEANDLVPDETTVSVTDIVKTVNELNVEPFLRESMEILGTEIITDGGSNEFQCNNDKLDSESTAELHKLTDTADAENSVSMKTENSEKQKDEQTCTKDNLQLPVSDSLSLITDDITDAEVKKINMEDADKSNFFSTCELKESEGKTGDLTKEAIKNDDDKKKTKVEEKVEEEPEFSWERHLQEAGSEAIPSITFRHVESSLENGFVKGMKLEVPNKCNKDTYWVASVLMTCGPLLRLRFDGYEEDSTSDFWCDLMTSEIHPIGWCAQNNQILQPPEAIKDKFEDWRDFLVKSLTGARTAPAYLLDKTTGITPVDQLKQGMRLEIQHPVNPVEVWLVKILENVGGRLYLRFEGVEAATHDFWLFYLNHRLHPIGWAKTNKLDYKPPKELTTENTEVDWSSVLESALKESEKYVLPMAVFKDQEEITDHSFEEGMKLEAVNPINKTQICPATVIKVLNSQYFVVEIDDLENTEPEYKIRFSCHSGSKCIFPAKWCHYKGGVSITPPKGWPKPTLSWIDYLEHCNAQAAPESCFIRKVYDYDIMQGMKCEAVNPGNPNQICVATVYKVVEPLLWIHLDNSHHYRSSHIEHFESHNLFPVGWCESNGYQLRLPVNIKRTASVLPENYDATSEAYHSNKGGEWCPKVYYNHQCFSGPHLSKGRIASLPKCIGPGPINLVMKEVISMLINVAYKPCRVLKELQLEGKPSPDMHQQTLKAKYKGKSYRAIVEICRHADDLQEFCRNVCKKLECCTNLISPMYITEECPEKCSLLTKTQYTYYNPKKKVGRPPGGHTNLENGPKKPGKKKKKRRINILSQKGEENGSVGDGEEDKESVTSETKTVDSNDNGNGEKPVKRKYVHHVPLPSDIKTRGAKLPKYSFERKTHKKIPIQEKQMPKPHKKSTVKEEKPTSPHHISPVKTAMKLSSNPLHWSVQDVVRFIKETDCAPVARVFKEQEIDGQALLLLNLPTVQEYLDLKLGPAIKLCHHIEKIKVAFFQQYA